MSYVTLNIIYFTKYYNHVWIAINVVYLIIIIVIHTNWRLSHLNVVCLVIIVVCCILIIVCLILNLICLQLNLVCLQLNLVCLQLNLICRLFQLSGAAFVAVGIWTLLYKTLYVSLLSSGAYEATTYLLLATGALILIVGVIGCCGACTLNRVCLMTVSIPIGLIYLFSWLIKHVKHACLGKLQNN